MIREKRLILPEEQSQVTVRQAELGRGQSFSVTASSEQSCWMESFISSTKGYCCPLLQYTRVGRFGQNSGISERERMSSHTHTRCLCPLHRHCTVEWDDLFEIQESLKERISSHTLTDCVGLHMGTRVERFVY